MSLIEKIEAWYKEEKYPPDGPELGPDVEQVSYEENGQARWGTYIAVIYKQGNEYVRVDDVAPATEMQDWGDYGEPDIYPVERVEETRVVVSYRKVENELKS